VMPKGKIVPMQVPYDVVADSVGPIVDWFRDCDVVGPMELVELVGIADEKIHHAALRIGRALPEEHLHLVEVHARERRRIAPSKRQLEAEFFRIEVDRGSNVGDGEAGVDLLAFDERSGRSVHGMSLAAGRARRIAPRVWALFPLYLLELL